MIKENDLLNTLATSMPTPKYVTAVFRHTTKWLQDHPMEKKYRIHFFSTDKFDRIASGVEDVLPERYSNWEECYGSYECDTELKAWKAAVSLQKKLVAQGVEVDMISSGSNRQLYIIEMSPSVINETQFAEMNAALIKDSIEIFAYVGETSQSPEHRYDKHRSEQHQSKTKWGRKYFLTPFDKAYREDLLLEYQDTGNNVKGLNKHEALEGELALRRWLQNQKAIAAYSN